MSVKENAEKSVVTFLTINDVYALEPVQGKGGLPQMQTMLKRERETCKTPVVSVCGDFLSASAAANKYKGAHMVELFERMGVDKVVLGNHEFDYGETVLMERMAESSFMWYGSNVLLEDALLPGCVDTNVEEVQGVKVGFFGVCTLMTPKLSSPSEAVVFADILETAERCVAQLQADGAEFVVAYTHLSNNEDRQLARKLPQIDLILGGHVHEPFSEIVGDKTLIVKCGQNAYWLGRIDAHVRRGAKGEVARIDYDWRFALNADQEADEELLEVVKQYRVSVDNPDAALPLHIGQDMHSLSSVVRTRSSSMGSMIADAMRLRMGADLGMINGGFIRGDVTYPAGTTMTRAHMATELPFTAPAVMVRIKGQQIWEAMEQQLAAAPLKSGAFPQVSGFVVRYDEGAEPGSRMRALYLAPEHGTRTFAGGVDEYVLRKDELEAESTTDLDEGRTPMDLEAEYTIAITEFLHTGGDGLTAYQPGVVVEGSPRGMLIIDVVFEFFDSLAQGEMLLAPVSSVEKRVLDVSGSSA